MSSDGFNKLNLRSEFIIIAGMCLGYAALMLCRTTVGIAGPAMLLDDELNLDKTAFGAILGWGTAGNLLGKLTNGILADKVGGQKVFILAIALSAAAIFMFGTVSNNGAFFLFYFLTIFAKSAGWPSIANIIKVWFLYPKHGRVWGFIATSSRASSVVATLVLGSLLLVMPWRGLFVAAAVFSVIILLVLAKFLRSRPSDMTELSDEAAETVNFLTVWTRNHPLKELETRDALSYFVKSLRFWLICLSVTCLAVLFEFQAFIPVYLSETFELAPAQAGMASSAFPLGCLVAVFSGGFVFDKLSKKSLIYAIGGMLVLAFFCLLLLWSLANIQLNAQLELALTIGTIFTFGFTISPAYYLPMSVFSIDFGGKHCGLLIGLIDAVAYAGTMVFDFVGGSVADQEGGWQHFLLILVVTAVGATISMVLFLYTDYRDSARKSSFPGIENNA